MVSSNHDHNESTLLTQTHRNFVTDYWPAKGIPGLKLKQMYEKVAAAEKEIVDEAGQGEASPAQHDEMKANGVKHEED